MSDETHKPSSSQNELPRKPWVGLELTVEPTALSPQGLGRAELELLVGPQRAPRRYIIDVRGALPGERARVCVISVKRRQLMARLVELNKGLYAPIRGNQSVRACEVAMAKWGGFYGPFVDV